MFSKIISLSFLGFFLQSRIFAAGETDFPLHYYDVVAVIFLILIVLSLLSIIYFEGKTKALIDKQFSLLSKHTEMTVEHSGDTVRESDTKIPAWFSLIFICTILFGAYYLIQYHLFVSGHSNQNVSTLDINNTSAENGTSKNSKTTVNEENVTQLTDPADLKLGKQIFETNCIACHAADGGGIVGPNLTDEYWLKGGGIKNVFHTIKYGVPDKGMISWQSVLNDKQIQEAASFVLSLQGTKPANPKPPEGEIWKGK